MEKPKMFSVVRLGPKGPDTCNHVFSVKATGNKELTDEMPTLNCALLNGASGTDPVRTRLAVEMFAEALNEVVASYYRGEFHKAIEDVEATHVGS